MYVPKVRQRILFPIRIVSSTFHPILIWHRLSLMAFFYSIKDRTEARRRVAYQMHLVKNNHIGIADEIIIIYCTLIGTYSDLSWIFPLSKIYTYMLFRNTISQEPLNILFNQHNAWDQKEDSKGGPRKMDCCSSSTFKCYFCLPCSCAVNDRPTISVCDPLIHCIKLI